MTVSSLAEDTISERIPLVEVAPVCVMEKSLPVEVMAVADDAIIIPIPSVSPLQVNLIKPAAVVAELAVIDNMLPVVATTPEPFVKDIAVPVVTAVTMLNPIPVVVPNVARILVPAIEASAKSKRTPVVVDVFVPVELNLKSEPPEIMADVVWTRLMPTPVVRPTNVPV
jgi:hypothetical protein